MICYRLQNDEFQYKICYSKIVHFEDDLGLPPVFQYKICYSKILVHQVLEYREYYFNTKFVIAK